MSRILKLFLIMLLLAVPSVAQQSGSTLAPKSTTGYVTNPALAPTLASDSSTTISGSLGNGTYYCVYTYKNRNGETVQSPVGSVTLSGGTSTQKFYARLTDYGWITGAYSYRLYCSTSSSGPFYLQTPANVFTAVANNGFVRTSNVVTVTTSANHPFRKGLSVTIAGAAGCGVSPNGTFEITDVPSATTFTYAQTAANDSVCGGASATGAYSPALTNDTNAIYAGVLGLADFIVGSLATSGSTPPTSNTATIDALQVEVNRTHDLSNGVFTSRLGDIKLSATTYTLTTPLILYESMLNGYSMVFQEQACYTGTLITSSWNDVDVGTAMVMGPHVNLEKLCVTATGTSNGLMMVGGTTNMNGLMLKGVFTSVPSTSTTVAGFRVHRVNVSQQHKLSYFTVNGGRFATHFTNSSFGPATWDGGRSNCGSDNASSALTHWSGPIDWQRGMKVASDQVPSSVAITWTNHNTESCKGIVVDFGGGRPVLGAGWGNADGTHPAGTEAIVKYWFDQWSQGGSASNYEILPGAVVLGSSNVLATLKHGYRAGFYGNTANRNIIAGRVTTSTGSGSSVCMDMNSIATPGIDFIGSDNCRLDPTTTTNSVINVPATVDHVRVLAGLGYDSGGNVFGWNEFEDSIALRQSGARSRLFRFWIDNTSPFNLKIISGTNVASTPALELFATGNHAKIGGLLRIGTNPADSSLGSATIALGLPTGLYIAWRNAANTADVLGVAKNSSDNLVLCNTNCGKTTTDKQIESTLATGTAPFSVASTTNVANLNASSLNGATFAAPGTIGGATPAAATFTTLTANTSIVIAGSGAKTGFSGNSATIGTTSGVLTSGNCAKFDGNGNIVDYGGTCGGTSAATNVVANVTIVTATTTTTGVQTLQTGTIGAGTATVGSQYQFTAKTEYTNGDSAVAKSANHQWGLDGSALGSACQTATIGAGASAQAYLELHITVLSTGAGGTAMIYTRCTPSTTSTDVSNMSATTVAFDTTVAHTISQRVNQTATTDANSTMIGRFLFGMKYN